MKKFFRIQNPKARFAVALGAGIGFGQMILRVLSENLGAIPGILGGAAATAALVLGFFLILGATAKSNNSADDR